MKIETILLATFGIFSLASATLPAQQTANETRSPCGAAACPFLNPALTPEARAKDLVGRMTLEEKVSQMQDVAPAIPRLGILAYNWWNEALHGVARNGFATNFPQSIGLAATWDTALMHRIATTITAGLRDLRSGRRTSTSIGIRAGVEAWKPLARIHF